VEGAPGGRVLAPRLDPPVCYDRASLGRNRTTGPRKGRLSVEPVSHVARCDECVALLVDYLEGELPPDRARALELHLDLCPPCVAFVNTYRGTVNVARTLQAEDIPPELTQRLIDFLRKEQASRTRIPD
jgi:hypothetical protein